MIVVCNWFGLRKKNKTKKTLFTHGKSKNTVFYLLKCEIQLQQIICISSNAASERIIWPLKLTIPFIPRIEKTIKGKNFEKKNRLFVFFFHVFCQSS